MFDDPVFVVFPRWLEESGLPEELNMKIGAHAWSIFKKLTEAEVEQNLRPDWFSVSIRDLVEWTGIAEETLEEIVARLELEGYLRRRKMTAKSETLRLKFEIPLKVPRSSNEIADRLKEKGWAAHENRFRYLENPRLRKLEDKVLNLYEQCFGASRLNDRIAADLLEMARMFEYASIEEAFREARREKKRSLKWVYSRLNEGQDHERVSQTGRSSKRKGLARRASTK